MFFHFRWCGVGTEFKLYYDYIIFLLLKRDRQCQIILVENSNDIEIKEKIEKEFDNVNCILTGENLGYGKANNIGLKELIPNMH